MAIAPLPSALSFPSLPRCRQLYLPTIAAPNLARRTLAHCCFAKRSRRSRAIKSNEELCDELREFNSSVGLPEDRAPSMNKLRENGRTDLANIVRRRGYKVITELLLNSNGKNHSEKSSLKDSLTAKICKTAGDLEDTNSSIDCTYSSNTLEKDMIDSNGVILDVSEESLLPKAAKFVQIGDLDKIGGEDSELCQNLTFKAYEQDFQNEINHLKNLMEQNEVELSQIKQQVEDENVLKYFSKIALNNLYAKGTTELGDMKRKIAEKDMELHMAEENLSELIEVHIDYWTDGEIIEVAGSFNGWQHRVRMNPHPSSEHINPHGSRRRFLWTAVLWLYPGVYEIKFIVDDHWQIDYQREIITSGGIVNNVLKV
ncbi:protein PTST homolog 3, chloroplastic-like isoform X1 [Zingiber officinale]|uniref:protein PTST homolog 3, chloroplastic-like isoform X1 n=1 Tax=Zingiber officinale TaxID=94328 RepID=UPI001C4B1E8D|nr:protein PTST homolog 3, chloroplastic-like isoform X1 [Zingiber officinale]